MGDPSATMSMALDGFVEDTAGGVDDVFGRNALSAEGPGVTHLPYRVRRS